MLEHILASINIAWKVRKEIIQLKALQHGQSMICIGLPTIHDAFSTPRASYTLGHRYSGETSSYHRHGVQAVLSFEQSA